MITGNTVIFNITDDGLGDDDPTANGTIVDPGGPGVGGWRRGAPPDAVRMGATGTGRADGVILDGKPMAVLGAEDLDGIN